MRDAEYADRDRADDEKRRDENAKREDKGELDGDGSNWDVDRDRDKVGIINSWIDDTTSRDIQNGKEDELNKNNII